MCKQGGGKPAPHFKAQRSAPGHRLVLRRPRSTLFSAASGQRTPYIRCTSLPQVVSDYLTAFDDPALMMRAGEKPVTIFTYRMAFWPAAAG